VPICHTLSCGGGTLSDIFGIHGDKVVYDDGAHSKGTEGVGEGVQSVVGHCGRGIGKARDCKKEGEEWSKPL
jgi:hypothetical protein